MIQVYLPDNKNYEMNGDVVLVPDACELEAELSGSWTMNMSHPLDDEGRWKYIVEEAVISAPTFIGEKQLYRISEIDKSENGISAKAYPIFFDSADEVFLMDVRPTNKSGQQALDEMLSGSRFSGLSNIRTGNTAYFVRRNMMDAINGTDEPTFIGTWGGEPVYDNYRIIINEHAGGDYGAQVRYGMNMEHINHKINMSNMATRIVPVAYNGRVLSTGYVDSPLIEKYAKIYTKEIKFEEVKLQTDINDSESLEEIVICKTQEELDEVLTEKCNEQFDLGIDLPEVTIEVDMIAIENTEEYRDFTDLVKASLGDTVECYNSKLDIATKARVIKINWDCITNSVKAVVLGAYKESALERMGSTIDRIESIFNNKGNVMAERVQGILDGMKTQIKIQSTTAQPVDGRVFVVEDLNPESPLYGCMVYGTQGIQISKQRTADGRTWDFTTAMTASGVVADTIITGLLSDKTGSNYWNLDTGDFKLTKGNVDINGVARGTHPIKFTGHSGCTIEIGPYDILMQRDDLNHYSRIGIGGIEVGTRNGNSYSPNAHMLFDGGIVSLDAYETTTSEAPNVVVWSNGAFRRSASSSERYKKDITEEIKEELDPRRLYEVPVKMFKYKEGYLSEEDDKNGKDVIGFIVEDLERCYPAAVQYVAGKPEMWNANILIPAMMKLIQDLNIRVERMEENNGN